MLFAAGSEALFVRRQTVARLDAERRDEMIGDFDAPTRNPPGIPWVRMRDSRYYRWFQRERATGVEPATSSLGSFP